MKIIGWTKATRHARTQKLGAKAIVRPTNAHGWEARYEVDTHGLSPAELKDKLEEMELRHEKWAQRLNGFAAVLGVEFVIGGTVYRICDCTIPSGRVHREPELLVGVREVTQDGKLQRVPGWPIALIFDSLESVWPDARIIQEVRQRLQAARDVQAADNAYKEKFNALVRDAGGL